MIYFRISPNEELRLEYTMKSDIRFSSCKMQYITGLTTITLYEDYLYVFVEEMLGRIKNIPCISNDNMFGKLGKWQEYYYFEEDYIKEHLEEITESKKSSLISTEKYGLFLYNHNETIWLEINKSFDQSCNMTPFEYYCCPENYRVSFNALPRSAVEEWKKTLESLEISIKNL